MKLYNLVNRDRDTAGFYAPGAGQKNNQGKYF